MQPVKLNEEIVLKLNKQWIGFETLTIGSAVTFLASEHKGEKPGFAIAFDSVKDENDEWVFSSNPTFLSWDEWVKLEVREGDRYIMTSRGKIRAPLVVICAKYAKLPVRQKRLSAGNIWERDGGVCQYTGQKVTKKTGNLDHVIPRDLGGRDTWENMVVSLTTLNTAKSNRTNEQMGYKLIRQPKAPKATVSILRKHQAPLPEQRPFLPE